MQTIIDILDSLGVATLGVIVYYLRKFRKHLSKESIQTKVFWSAVWHTMRVYLLWTYSSLTVLIIIFYGYPPLREILNKTFPLPMVDYTVASNIVIFFLVGIGLIGIADSNPQEPTMTQTDRKIEQEKIKKL